MHLWQIRRFNILLLAASSLLLEQGECKIVSPPKPAAGFSRANITGTCQQAIALANLTNPELRDLQVNSYDVPLPAPDNVQRAGLENAATPPERAGLWNGRDLAGWKFFFNDPAIDPDKVWSAVDGVLRLATKANGYLRTEKIFSNYHLHVEWRWPSDASTNSNSGVLVHVGATNAIWPACFECQLKSGNAGQVIGMGADIPDAPLINNRKRAPRQAKASEKPFGEWNACDIYARGDSLEVFVNGVRQNRVEKLPLTAGSIALQMEGYPIEFRNVWTQPF